MLRKIIDSSSLKVTLVLLVFTHSLLHAGGDVIIMSQPSWTLYWSCREVVAFSIGGTVDVEALRLQAVFTLEILGSDRGRDGRRC